MKRFISSPKGRYTEFMNKCSGKDWFLKWFDSPYYHILYQNRDDKEAGFFLEKLMSHLSLPAGSSILDLACGKGRHSIFLHTKGYDVTGIDLSRESIAMAKASESEGLSFSIQDMRDFHLGRKFDGILNLFTSFGYFQDMSENKRVIQNVCNHLNSTGFFVLDYLNASRLCDKYQPEQVIEKSGIRFEIEKGIEDNQIVKKIHIHDTSGEFHFEERVQLLKDVEIISMLEEAGLKVIQTFGNYNLDPFQPEISDRFIIIARN